MIERVPGCVALLIFAAACSSGRGSNDWMAWAQEWMAADADIAEHGNEPAQLQSAMIRRDKATEMLETRLPGCPELIQAFHDPRRRRLAAAAVIVGGCSTDEVFESLLQPWSDADESTRRYRVVALRKMDDAQFRVFGSHIQTLLEAETSQRVRLEGLSLVKRLDPSLKRDTLAWYCELDDPMLTRYAFAIAATDGDDTVLSVGRMLVQRGRTSSVRLLCSHVTDALVRSKEMCDSLIH